jgi:branched-chain amino acid transport system ATP-binding protein
MADLLGVEHLSKRTVLVYGRVIASGKPEDIRNNTQVRDADLGEQEVVHG